MATEEKFEKLVDLIENAGEKARQYFYQEEDYSNKEDQSVVTKIDIETEKLLREFIAQEFPNDTIVGEEGNDVIGDSGFVWYIDPIDGTGNFVRKIPLFSITATRLGPGPEGSLAGVHNPVSQQTYSSLMENGVYENKNVRRPASKNVDGRLLISILSKSAEPWVYPTKYALTKELGLEYGKCLSYSAGLLELAYVASGRLDAVLSLLNSPWDTAAGLYLNKAAGSTMSVFEEGKWREYTGAIKELYGDSLRDQKVYLVSRPDIHQELTNFIGDPKRWAK